MTKKIFMVAVLAMAVTICVFQNNVAEAEDDVTFELVNVKIDNGKCDIEGFFHNNGNKAATVTSTKFLGALKDLKGNVMYNIDFDVYTNPEECIVPAHGKFPVSFTLWSEEVTAYDNEFKADLNYMIKWNY